MLSTTLATTIEKDVYSAGTDCPSDEGFPLFLYEDIPAHYYKMDLDEIATKVMVAKEKLGSKLQILAHHYQRDETFQFGDKSGDSLNLSREAAQSGAKYILFCGVHFMAETADILTSDEQSVILPNLTAGCSMADMAELDNVQDCFDDLTAVLGGDSIIPITYINSNADLKAFCGRNNGAVCTSSNALKIMDWALQQNKKVLFFPDQHLGRNSANALGIGSDKIKLYKRHQDQGGLEKSDIENAQVFLWNGFCSVHARFNVKQIDAARARVKNVKVIVHPECSQEVVDASDYSGSTNKIIEIISQADNNTHWAVGTEINLVHRLNTQFKDQNKKVFSLSTNICPCSTMFQTHPANVLWVLDNLLQNRVINQIKVDKQVAHDAKIALDRMLAI